jgi:hypothetical protein
LLYGETIPETRLWEKEGYLQKELIDTAGWKHYHSTALESIILNQPWLFLDEIQLQLLAATSTLWATSTIYDKMQHLGWSLQVVLYVANQRDEEERSAYRSSVENTMFHPSQLVFLDETAKDRSASRRRRFWSQRGITQHHLRYSKEAMVRDTQ